MTVREMIQNLELQKRALQEENRILKEDIKKLIIEKTRLERKLEAAQKEIVKPVKIEEYYEEPKKEILEKNIEEPKPETNPVVKEPKEEVSDSVCEEPQEKVERPKKRNKKKKVAETPIFVEPEISEEPDSSEV